ncbi:Porin subfamily [Chelatococcus sambhunathii]|uniref:Porin n=1 Tax=Chelatococcus sambhunathii TaxID=363953 RepID=A0ABM9U714_9HYPH|nr:porin [Chelatococcus sambhunathii]CUA89316.1 Porin subfamily [Chelatococcus sambhunathii]
MRVVSQLLLGGVAGLALAGGAKAADLPMTKAAPVEYVRVCSLHGAGFFYIPGSDTCIKIGGRVRAEYRYLEPLWNTPGDGRENDATGFRAVGRLNVDARTATDWGTLRAFVQVDVFADTGVYNAQPGPAGDSTDVVLDKAYIQWAGITAGRATSFFDFYANDLNFGAGALGSLGSDLTVNLLAYTATFGNGFSATIALEDRSAHTLNGVTYAQAGQRMPDVVANLRLDQDWGSAQLAGALHQLNSVDIGAGLGGVGFGSGPLGSRVGTEYGYAIQAGVQVNLPMLAPGDTLWLQAAYADGAISYLGVYDDFNIGPVSGLVSEGVIVNGDIKKTRGWGATAAFLHYWTPSIRQALFGNYTSLDYSAATLQQDFKVWTVGSNVIWSPVSAFDIGLEVIYQKLDVDRDLAAPVIVKRSEDIWEARLRLQREF